MTVALQASMNPAGWLRDRTFDVTFIVGITAISLFSGWIVVQNPSLFVPILILDLWLLGYHHVVATYTRLCFDAQGFRDYRFHLFVTPVIVLGVVLFLMGVVGAWTIPTLYLYWQWFHYTRQSYGVGQAYRRKAGGQVTESKLGYQAAIYILPLWGILYRSHQAPEKFLGMDLVVLPVPEIVVTIAGLCAAAAVGWWLVQRLVDWWHGRRALAYTLFMLSHFAIFIVGYVAIDNVDHGWLVINIWHNAQYVLFVWFYNNNKFRDGVDPKAKFLSLISQSRNMWLYFTICVFISTLVYLVLSTSVSLVGDQALSLALIVFMTINFHHYVVDGVIWKLRRKSISDTLGINA